MILEKGSIDNLVGKVLVYADINNTNPSEPEIISTHITMQKESSNKLPDFLQENYKNKGNEEEKKTTPLFILSIEEMVKEKYQHEINKTTYKDSDIINLGAFSNQNIAFSAIHSIVQLYLIKYIDQQTKNVSTINHQTNNEIIQKEYKSFKTTESIEEHIKKQFIDPMNNSIYKKPAEYNKIKNNFLKFSEESNFYEETEKLCKEIEKNKPKQVINNHIKLIDHIHQENYEKAASIRNYIKKL